MGRFIDLSGQRFGRLIILDRNKNNKHNQVMWRCRCDCGKEVIAVGGDLKNNTTRSCGCLQREKASEQGAKTATHGMGRAAIYNVWCNMKARCYNPNTPNFKNYGGRDIKICKRWLNSFENFYKDMGDCPEGLSLDRKDNNAGYCSDNCRWTTRKNQNRNKRNVCPITYKGVAKCLVDWSKILGINYNTLYYRIKRYPPEIAFNKSFFNVDKTWIKI